MRYTNLNTDIVQSGPKKLAVLYALTLSNIDRFPNLSLSESGVHL